MRNNCLRNWAVSCSLLCPFRCGSNFGEATGLATDLAEHVASELLLMKTAQQAAVYKAEEDGEFTEAVRAANSSPAQIVRYAMERYDCYACGECKRIFAAKKLCGFAGEEAEEGAQEEVALCQKCTTKERKTQKIRLKITHFFFLDDNANNINTALLLCLVYGVLQKQLGWTARLA